MPLVFPSLLPLFPLLPQRPCPLPPVSLLQLPLQLPLLLPQRPCPLPPVSLLLLLPLLPLPLEVVLDAPVLTPAPPLLTPTPPELTPALSPLPHVRW